MTKTIVFVVDVELDVADYTHPYILGRIDEIVDNHINGIDDSMEDGGSGNYTVTIGRFAVTTLIFTIKSNDSIVTAWTLIHEVVMDVFSGLYLIDVETKVDRIDVKLGQHPFTKS